MKKYLTLSLASIFVILIISYLINNNYSSITNLFSRKNIKIETNDFPVSNDFVFPKPSNGFSLYLKQNLIIHYMKEKLKNQMIIILLL